MTPVAQSNVQLIPKHEFDDLIFQHGTKKYQITFIKQRIAGQEGSEKTIDLQALSKEDKTKFIEEARRVLDATKGHMNVNEPHSITCTFTHTPNYPTILNKTVGLIFNRFKYQTAPVILDTIVYKATATDSETTFHAAKELEPEDHAKLSANFQTLHMHISEVAHPKPKKAPKPQEQPAPAPANNTNNNNNPTANSDLLNEEDDEIPLTFPVPPPPSTTNDNRNVENNPIDDAEIRLRNNNNTNYNNTVHPSALMQESEEDL